MYLIWEDKQKRLSIFGVQRINCLPLNNTYDEYLRSLETKFIQLSCALMNAAVFDFKFLFWKIAFMRSSVKFS